MILRTRRGRSGITLTEILISIMIMGVGIVSLATLFPLGLLRLRDAARASRSALLNESAAADLSARNLLNKASFLNLLISPWYVSGGVRYDPWVQDTPSYGGDAFATPYGVYRGSGSFTGAPPSGDIAGTGLPVAYDPLWRFLTYPPPSATLPNPTSGYYLGATYEARFASGLGTVRRDPNAGSSPLPSAHGLQRLTNFNPVLTNLNSVPEIFVSPEDVILQPDKDVNGNKSSPLVPALSTTDVNPRSGLPTPVNEFRYTWMFTGQQADSTNGSIFDGSIVIFENRPFNIDQATAANSPFNSALGVVGGEPVVEAVFGYGKNILATAGAGYALSANRTVLLRWPDTMPDPEVKIGSWIADVTYERNATVDNERAVVDPNRTGAPQFFPYQRCDWYQVAKRTTAGPGVAFAADTVTYREMTVWVTTPLRAQTLLLQSNGEPFHVNAALVSPYVVNVFPRTVYTR